MKIEQKTVSVIKRKDGENYALVEALSRVLYPELPLEDFINAIDTVLGIEIVSCNYEEEKEYIKFYDIPTVALRCNKMVKINVFKEILAPLSYMFKPKPEFAENIDTEENCGHLYKGSKRKLSNNSKKKNTNKKRKLQEVISKFVQPDIEMKRRLVISIYDVMKGVSVHDVCSENGVYFRP